MCGLKLVMHLQPIFHGSGCRYRISAGVYTPYTLDKPPLLPRGGGGRISAGVIWGKNIKREGKRGNYKKKRKKGRRNRSKGKETASKGERNRSKGERNRK
jgi:hypothetical protein